MGPVLLTPKTLGTIAAEAFGPFEGTMLGVPSTDCRTGTDMLGSLSPIRVHSSAGWVWAPPSLLVTSGPLEFSKPARIAPLKQVSSTSW